MQETITKEDLKRTRRRLHAIGFWNGEEEAVDIMQETINHKAWGW